jgi:hypothetical protein
MSAGIGSGRQRHEDFRIFSEKGRAALMVFARRNFAAETIFMALVIFCVFLTLAMRLRISLRLAISTST